MSIEVQSISCKAVKSLALLNQKPSLSVAASLVAPPYKTKRQLQQTPVDRDGGRSAEWDQLMRFDLGADADALPLLMLEFEVTTHGGVLGSKVVGRVFVRVADLMTGAPVNKSVSYQIRAPDKRPNGMLTFTYKSVDPAATTPFSHRPAESIPPPDPPAIFYPRPGMDHLDPPLPETSWGYSQIAETCSIYPPLPDTSLFYVPSSPWVSDSVNDHPEMNSIYPPPAPPPPTVAAYPPPAPYGALEAPFSFHYPIYPPGTPAAYNVIDDVYYYPPPHL